MSWSKNPKPLLRYLPILKQRGIGCYIQYSLNDYEEEGLEKNVPPLKQLINILGKMITLIKTQKTMKTIDLKNKNNIQYEQSIKSAGQLFKDAYSIAQMGGSKNNESLQRKTNASKSLRERLYEESSRQQKELIDWAQKNKNLIVEPNDYFEEEYGESQPGSETTVWVANDNGNNVAVKNISLNHYATPEKLLDRILIHNVAFPSTAMEVLKVGASDKGISIIVKQPWIEDSGTYPTLQEIEDYMSSQGFTHTKGQGVNAEYSNDNYVVSDIRPENVIKQSVGTIAVIDCFAMLKGEKTQRISQSALLNFISSLSETKTYRISYSH